MAAAGPSPWPPLPALPSVAGPVRSVRVRAPLSIANVGPGFDHFGLCLEGPADVLELRRARASGLEVVGDANVPRDGRRNAATVAVGELLRLAGRRIPVEARLWKGYPGGSGIGSSGASAAAGALAAAALLSLDASSSCTTELVLRAARRGEEVACGSPHLDNASASLFGGFVLLEPGELPRVHRLTPPPELRIVVALPELRVETRRARALLPRDVPLRDAAENSARAGALLHGLLTGDAEQVGRNLVDRLAEPYRESLVPGLSEARLRAREAGAWGVALAGSGPAVFALSDEAASAGVAAALVQGFAEREVRARSFVSRVGGGAEVVGWG